MQSNLMIGLFDIYYPECLNASILFHYVILCEDLRFVSLYSEFLNNEIF